MDRKRFLKTLFAYGAAVAMAPSMLVPGHETLLRYPQFGFQFRLPERWVHLAIPRFEYLTQCQRKQLATHDWFDWIRQISGLPVAILSQNEEPWTRPTAMVAAYANPLPQGVSFDEFMTGTPEDLIPLFPKGRLLEGNRARLFGATRGSEFAIAYDQGGQMVRSRAAVAWGSRFEICLALEDYPEDGVDAESEIRGVLDSLEVS